jgi:hypothetical protein
MYCLVKRLRDQFDCQTSVIPEFRIDWYAESIDPEAWETLEFQRTLSVETYSFKRQSWHVGKPFSKALPRPCDQTGDMAMYGPSSTTAMLKPLNPPVLLSVAAA